MGWGEPRGPNRAQHSLLGYRCRHNTYPNVITARRLCDCCTPVYELTNQVQHVCGSTDDGLTP